MPELPEVETVVRDLRPLLVGRTLGPVRRGGKSLRKPWRPAWDAALAGLRVAAVRRRGKWILIDLADAGLLVVHLGMTGQFTVAPADFPAPDHTHLVWPLDDGRELRFRDVRRFGSATYHADAADAERELSAGLGPEPWDLLPGPCAPP